MKKIIKIIFKKVEAKLSRGTKGTNGREGVRGRRVGGELLKMHNILV